MKKTSALSFLLLTLIFSPLFLIAQEQGVMLTEKTTDAGGLIVCDGPDCNYASIILFIQRAIDLLVRLATLVTMVLLVFTGFNIIRAGDSPKARQDAKKMAGNILIGFFIILVAWLVVYTILKVLVDPSQFDEYSLLK